MAWLASGLLALTVAGRLGRSRGALMLALAALAFSPVVYPLSTLAIGVIAAAVLHLPLLWAARRAGLPPHTPLLMLALGTGLCLFGLFGPKEGLF